MLCVGVMNGNTLIIESAQKLSVVLQHEVKDMFEFVTTASSLDGEHEDSFYMILSQSLSKYSCRVYSCVLRRRMKGCHVVEVLPCSTVVKSITDCGSIRMFSCSTVALHVMYSCILRLSLMN